MSSDWHKGPRCGVDGCRSRRFKVETDGLTYCQNGHQKSEMGFSLEDDDFISSAARKTRKKLDNEDRPPKFYTGRAATELYLQCFQIVLRKQAWWLVHEQGYPQELESLVRNLWALRLGMLRHLIEESDDGPQSSSTDPSEERPEAASGGSTSEDELNTGDVTSRGVKKRIAKADTLPTLSSTLGLLYLALLLLRLPVSVADVRVWVLSQGFTYLRAIDAIPMAMKQNINPTSLRTFLARSGCPASPQIHVETMDMCAFYARHASMNIPPLNAMLLLNRHVQKLGLHLDILLLVRRLALLLDVDFTFPHASRIHVPLHHHPELQIISFIIIAVKHLYPFDNVTRHPKSLEDPAALRLPWQKYNELVSQKRPEKKVVAESEKHEAMLNTTEADVLSMSTEEMDKYLAWSTETWLKPSTEDSDLQPSAFQQALFDFFPLPGEKSRDQAADGGMHEHEHEEPVHDAETAHDRDKSPSHGQNDNDNEDEDEEKNETIPSLAEQVTSMLEPVAPVPEEDDTRRTLRPGSRYRYYRNPDDLPQLAMPFFKAAAKAVALEIPQLLKVVYHWELQLRVKILGS